MKEFENSLSFAQKLDQQDELARFKGKFYTPIKNGDPATYFCGNSLGLQPKKAESFFEKEFEKWQQMAVEGHFEESDPWVMYHHKGKEELAEILGARPSEVVAMNNLTTNIHLMLASFYQPSDKRKKIIIEEGAFPSDHYAVSSFMKKLGVSPEEHLIQLAIPEDGYLSNDKIVETIKETGEELALVFFPGIQYYTGQYFDLGVITAAAHEVGAYAGFDLAHAAGNVPVNLHENNVDFAVWCSYKYMNSGPGNVAGAFVHEKHGTNEDLPRLTGWWGHNEKTRFQMDNHWDPMPGVDGWMLSNVNIIANALHLASLSLFKEAGFGNLRNKSVRLTGYLEYLLTNDEQLEKEIKILTPSNPEERGCQLSLYLRNQGKNVFSQLNEKGYIMDWREPNVIRVAPTPLYNSFTEVYNFVNDLKSIITSI
jgi:kynureninase